MNHVIMFSGGAGSFFTALRVKAKVGLSGLYLLFTDTLFEDSDLYRFIVQAAAIVYDVPLRLIADLVEQARRIPPLEDALKGEGENIYIDPEIEEARRQAIRELAAETRRRIPGFKWIYEGRDPYQVFKDERRLGNSFVDPCSKIIKRRFANRYITLSYAPEETIIYVGYDWTEEHRYTKALPFWAKSGYCLECPLLEPPYIDKSSALSSLPEYGIDVPELYILGLAHNNCSGGCVKAGQGHYALIWDKRPRLFLYLMLKEQGIADHLGRVVSFLRKGEYGLTILYPLTHLKADLEAGRAIDRLAIGGCGCFSGEDAPDEEITVAPGFLQL
jgi:hypothetical protein